ncbi:MAG: hypothetical protein K2N38_00885 [Oscillospiraceae bacterium]|nr:hypothetical protein [Oscillospiraceae bacterium]
MTKSVLSVRVPQITSLETAIRLYYEHTELSNSDIKELFGKCSSATITRLKSKVRERMAEEKTPVWNANNVNTKVAYSTWGLDIDDLETRYQKVKLVNNS